MSNQAGGTAIGIVLATSLVSGAVAASAAAAEAPAASGVAVETVSITGRRLSDIDERREDSAARIVIGRKEIERYGDTSLVEVLTQQPGISYSGQPGRKGGEIRIRGMGSAYTQILVNGDPVPAGFTIDAISPSQVERIEIYKAATAEFGAQAIGGTINIILRAKSRGDKNQAALVVTTPDDRHVQPKVQLQYGGLAGPLTLATGVVYEGYRELDARYTKETTIVDGAGTLVSDERDTSETQSAGHDIKLTPSLKWEDSFGDKVSADGFFMRSSENRRSRYVIDQPVGTPPYATDDSGYRSRFDVDRLTLSNTVVGGEGLARKLETRITFNSAAWTKSEVHDQVAPDGTQDILANGVRADNHGVKGTLKLSDQIGEHTSYSAGAEFDANRRIEDWTQTDNGVPTGFESGTHLSSVLALSSAYGQVEWKPGKSLFAYGGVRLESLLESSSDDAGELRHRFTMANPSMQVDWHVDGTDTDQVRASLSRGYRAPRVTDLLARMVVSYNNSPSSPDVAGNPGLRPEKAWSLDLTYEHYLADNGLLSATVFAKRIADTLLQQVDLIDSRWVSVQRNAGDTTSAGLELEAKFRLDQLLAAAPKVRMQSSVAWNWSSIDAIHGPDNRMFGQPPFVATAAADYTAGHGWVYGAKARWSSPYRVRTADGFLNHTGSECVIDAYLRWNMDATDHLRLGANNLLHRNTSNGLDNESTEGLESTRRSNSTWTTYTLSFTKDW